MITGPAGRFSHPTTRWVRRQVTRSHHRTKEIHNLAQATTKRRGASRSGAPANAISTEPRYQPALKANEHSQRTGLVISCPASIGGLQSNSKRMWWEVRSGHGRHLSKLPLA